MADSLNDLKSLSDRLSSIEVKLEVAKKTIAIASVCVTAIFGVGFFTLLNMARDQAIAAVRNEAAKGAFAAYEASAMKSADAAAKSAAEAERYDANIIEIVDKYKKAEPQIYSFEHKVNFQQQKTSKLTHKEPLKFTPKRAWHMLSDGSDTFGRVKVEYEFEEKMLIIKVIETYVPLTVRPRVVLQVTASNF